MDRKIKYWLPYFILWSLSYIVYPSWLVPGSPFHRYIYLLGFSVYFALLSLVYFKKVKVGAGRAVSSALIRKPDSVFLVTAIIFVLLHIHPMISLPLRTWTDEPSHACSGIQILQAVRPEFLYSGTEFRKFQWLARVLVLAICGVWIATRKTLAMTRLSEHSLNQRLFFLITAVVAVSHLIFMLLRNQPFYPYLYNPPALSRWLSLGITVLTQPNVFWVRLTPLLFCLLSSAIVYEIVILAGNDRVIGQSIQPTGAINGAPTKENSQTVRLARIAAAVFLFFPNVSYFSSSPVLGCGDIFFSLLPLYLMLRFFKSRDYADLYWCFFWAGAATLWKQPLATGLIYLPIILILHYIYSRHISLKESSEVKMGLIYWLLAVATFLPLFLVGQFLISLPYDVARVERALNPSELFHLRELSKYLISIPQQITFPGTILLFAGLVILLCRKVYFRQYWPLGISFVCWYLILTTTLLPQSSPHQRWQLPFYPFAALCIAIFFEFLLQKCRIAGLAALASYMCFMLSCSTFLHTAPLHKEYALYRTDFENPTHLGGFLPYEDMVLYMKKNLKPGSKVLADDFPDPREFYAFKHHLNVEWRLIKSRDELSPGVEALYHEAQVEGADYLFSPEPYYLSHIDEGAVEAIFKGDTSYFSLIKVFTGTSGRVGLFKVK